MEELAELKQLLTSGNTIDAIALVDELAEMSRKAIIQKYRILFGIVVSSFD